jgi:peroxiredoxin
VGMPRLSFSLALLLVASPAFAEKDRLDAGDEAPNFAAKTLNPDAAKTKVFTLDSAVGNEATEKKRAVVTSFVSASCESCQKQLKFLQALQAEYSKDLLVVAVAIDKEEADTRKMADAAAQSTFPVINDRFNIVAQRYFVQKPPYVYVIDESGKVAKVFGSYDESTNRSILDEVRKNLGVAVSDEPPPTLKPFMVAPKNEAVAATAIPKTEEPAAEPAAAPAMEGPIKKTGKGKKEKAEKPADKPAKEPKKVVGKPAKAAPPPAPVKGPKRVGRKP